MLLSDNDPEKAWFEVTNRPFVQSLHRKTFKDQILYDDRESQ